MNESSRLVAVVKPPKKSQRKIAAILKVFRPSKHPVDKLLPGSRTQAMKALLERAENQPSQKCEPSR